MYCSYSLDQELKGRITPAHYPLNSRTFCLFVLQCGAVIEAGNGAITPEGDAVLQRRGIPVLPVRGEDLGAVLEVAEQGGGAGRGCREV